MSRKCRVFLAKQANVPCASLTHTRFETSAAKLVLLLLLITKLEGWDLTVVMASQFVIL